MNDDNPSSHAPSLASSTPAMREPPNANNNILTIVKAQIVFLLSTLTEENFERNQIEARSLTETHGIEVYLHFIRRLIVAAWASSTVSTYELAPSLTSRLLVQETQRLARDPFLADRFREGIDKGDGDIFRQFDLVIFCDCVGLRPLERLILASSMLATVRVRKKPVNQASTIVRMDWNNAIMSLYSHPSFDHADLTPSQVAKLLSNLLSDPPPYAPVLDAQQRLELIVAAQTKCGPELMLTILRQIFPTLSLPPGTSLVQTLVQLEPELTSDPETVRALFSRFGITETNLPQNEGLAPSSSHPSTSPSGSTSHYDRTYKSRDYSLIDFGAPNLTGCWTKFDDVPFMTGGHSDIYRARLEQGQQAKEMQIIAVKVLRSIRIRPDCVPEEILRKRLMREMRVWSQLQHSNIVPFLGYAFSGSFPCMIAPWYENGSIPDYIARTPDADRTQLVLDSINGLVHLHSRDPPIVHGDLKATNILVDNNGHACITDFGLSRILEEGPSGLTTSTGVLGTHRWMAPELMLGERTCPTTAADIYSMTLLALEIYTGKIPFAHLDEMPFVMAIVRKSSPQRSHYRPFNPPEDLWRVFESGWSFEPSPRPDADNLKEEFEKVLAATSWR